MKKKELTLLGMKARFFEGHINLIFMFNLIFHYTSLLMYTTTACASMFVFTDSLGDAMHCVYNGALKSQRKPPIRFHFNDYKGKIPSHYTGSCVTRPFHETLFHETLFSE